MRDGSVMAHSDLVYFLSGSTDSAINLADRWIYIFLFTPLIYQYSNMAPRLSGQTSKFGVLFCLFWELREKIDLKNLQF